MQNIDKKNTNVVIIGSRGYVGKRLIETARQKDDVHFNFYEFNTENYTAADLFYKDWRHWTNSVQITPDYVINLGAMSDPTDKVLSIFFSYPLSCRFIGKYVEAMGAKLIHFSSYSPIKPTTFYGSSKQLGEKELIYKVPLADHCILRYGGDENEEECPSTILKFQHDKSAKLFMNCYHDFVDVDDICEAVLSLMTKKWQPGEFELWDKERCKVLTGHV